MPLRFQPPPFDVNPRPYDELFTPQSFDNIFNAYQRAKMIEQAQRLQQEQLGVQRGERLLQYGFDPGQVTPQLYEQARGEENFVEAPMVKSLREFIKRRSSIEESKLLGSRADTALKLSKAAGVGSDILNPEQFEAIRSGDINRMRSAFPAGIPKEALQYSASNQRMSNLEQERTERADERRKGRYRNYFLDLEQRDPVIKQLNKEEIGLNQVNSLIDIVREGNTVAASALGTKMARAMGEVGVLTESDISRYVQSGRLDRKAADVLSRWTRGRPSNASLNEIAQISEILNSNFRQKIQPRYDKFINTYSKIEGVEPGQFASELSIGYSGKGSGGAASIDMNEKKRMLREKLGLK